jgi:hypothetical protein
LKEYPMERTWDAEARAATAGRTAAERWTMCGNDRGHGPWPEPASEVLVALWPWRAGEPSDVAMAQFFWEGANSWRPSFRGPSGDRFKNVYAWAPMPSAPPMPDDLAAAIRSRSTSEQGDR